MLTLTEKKKLIMFGQIFSVAPTDRNWDIVVKQSEITFTLYFKWQRSPEEKPDTCRAKSVRPSKDKFRFIVQNYSCLFYLRRMENVKWEWRTLHDDTLRCLHCVICVSLGRARCAACFGVITNSRAERKILKLIMERTCFEV